MFTKSLEFSHFSLGFPITFPCNKEEKMLLFIVEKVSTGGFSYEHQDNCDYPG